MAIGASEEVPSLNISVKERKERMRDGTVVSFNHQRRALNCIGDTLHPVMHTVLEKTKN